MERQQQNGHGDGAPATEWARGIRTKIGMQGGRKRLIGRMESVCRRVEKASQARVGGRDISHGVRRGGRRGRKGTRASVVLHSAQRQCHGVHYLRSAHNQQAIPKAQQHSNYSKHLTSTKYRTHLAGNRENGRRVSANST